MRLDVHVIKLSTFERWISMRENSFSIDSVCNESVSVYAQQSDEIVSTYAQPAHAIVFEKYRKNPKIIGISTNVRT